MRIFKSVLVSLIGLTALMYALQGLASVSELRFQAEAEPQALDAYRQTFLSGSPAATLAAFALITLCQFAIAGVALKGAWNLYAARNATDIEYKEAKSAAIWAGGLSLLLWFLLALMIGAGLFQWGSDFGGIALTRAFQLGSTSALTILFVNGVRD